MMHIIKQFFLHFPWAILLVGILAYTIVWLAERYPVAVGRWVSCKFEHALIMAALVVGLVMPIRESWDMWRGNQVWYKTPFDYASWYLGGAAGVWVFYRFNKWIITRRK